MVAAMNPDTFSGRLRRHESGRIVLFVGDRDDIQMRAIESGSGHRGHWWMKVLKSIQRAASEAKVAIISSPHDTATTGAAGPRRRPGQAA